MKFAAEENSPWILGQGYRKNILLTERDLHCPGTLVQIVVIEPRTSVGNHFHRQTTEVFHMLSGEGKMTIGGTEVDLARGDTITCEPGEIHNAVNTGDEPWRYIVFKTNVVPDDSVWL